MRKMKAQGLLPVSRETETDISNQLVDALRMADQAAEKDEKKSGIESARAIVFESVNAPKEAAISPDFERVVEKIFVTEGFDAMYEKLEKDLRLDEKIYDYTSTMAALDRAETNFRNAHRLYVTARVEFERWEKENEVNFATCRNEATKALQREKDSGFRSKQITDADVASMCSAMFPEEWKNAEIKRLRYKLTIDSFQNLVEVHASRCRSLQVVVGKQR